jgi:adenylate cyclase
MLAGVGGERGAQRSEAPTRKRRWEISYRAILVVVIPLLVVITGALIARASYMSSRESTRSMTRALFAQAAAQTVERTRAHLMSAPPTVDFLARLLGAGASPPAQDDALLTTLLAALAANPGFTWVSYSDERGSFTGAERLPDGALLVNRSRIVDGKTVLDEHDVLADRTYRLRRHSDDYHYDPRTRPWYQQAVARQRRTWTDPYIFYGENIPGITCAAPVYDAHGVLRGVVTADFGLDSLSAFARTLRISPHAEVFVYTERGAVVAHPTAPLVLREPALRLADRAEIADPVARAFFGAAGRGSFAIGDTDYLAAALPFSPDADLVWNVAIVAPEADFMGDLQRANRNNLAIAAAIVLLALAVAMTFARHVARPLMFLAREMDRVGRFELDGDDPESSVYAEISRMNRTLAAMRRGLTSFAAYVPRELVRAVLASGQRAELGGTTKCMTVFFSDLAGFTTLSESMRPDELVEMLGGYFEEMSRVISGHRGTIDKFIGDAIMAFWNAPADESEHAALACEAALDCQAKLAAMKRADPALGGLSARIGVATGDVLVGNIGSPHRMNYTVMGDTANLASRLEGLGKRYGTAILVSEACYLAARGRVVMRAIDVVAVKGKRIGTRIYEPLCRRSDPEAAQADELARASFAALDAYLARRFDEAAEGYRALLVMRPGDAAFSEMLARAVRFRAAPPPEEWDGSFVATEK